MLKQNHEYFLALHRTCTLVSIPWDLLTLRIVSEVLSTNTSSPWGAFCKIVNWTCDYILLYSQGFVKQWIEWNSAGIFCPATKISYPVSWPIFVLPSGIWSVKYSSYLVKTFSRNLSGNQLTGPLPQSLIEKSNNGTLNLRFDHPWHYKSSHC